MPEVKQKRSAFRHYLNTTPNSQTATYSLINKGVSSLVIDMGTETSSSQYIAEDTATTETTGFTGSISIEQEMITGDAVFDYVEGLFESRAKLSDAHTELINVKTWKPIEGASGTYWAELQPVSIALGEIGGDQPDTPHISYTLNYRGDATIGKFNVSAGTFTTV